ncbi:MAG TPA: IS110 family transposase [Terriglobales bacterium]|nr:IS110 family transposase [Terriglobales bacterium]
MIIVGCDYHPSFQQIAFVDSETGELKEQRLEHREPAEAFYRELASRGEKVRVGMEASGHARWFERLLAELGIELWLGDAAVIRAKRGRRKPKTDRLDAQHILKLLLKDDFPKIWVPSWENRDLRQLLWHRHRMVQARTRMMNQLQAVALNEGLRCKKRLWREKGRKQLEEIRLARWASRRREDLLKLLDGLNPTIADLTQAINQEVEKSGEACRLMTHPGVGPLTALAFVLIIGKAERFQCGKQIAAYLGLVPPRGFQRRTASAGAYHQARQLAVALLAGGVGSGCSTEHSGMAKKVCPPDDATGTKDRQSRHGQKTGDSLVLDDAPGMGL